MPARDHKAPGAGVAEGVPPPDRGRQRVIATTWDLVATTKFEAESQPALISQLQGRVQSLEKQLDRVDKRWHKKWLAAYVEWKQHLATHVVVSRILGRWRGFCRGVRQQKSVVHLRHQQAVVRLTLVSTFTAWKALANGSPNQLPRLGQVITMVRLKAILSRSLRKWVTLHRSQNDAINRAACAVRRMRLLKVAHAINGWQYASAQRTARRQKAQWAVRRMQMRGVAAAFSGWLSTVEAATVGRQRATRAIRRIQKRSAASAFSGWQYATTRLARLRLLGRHTVARLLHRTLARAMSGWSSHAAAMHRNRALSGRSLKWMKLRVAARAYLRWLQYVKQCRMIAHALRRLRHFGTARAMQAWVSFVHEHQRLVKQAGIVVRRIRRAMEASTMDAWCLQVQTATRQRQKAQWAVRRMQMRGVAAAFSGWLSTVEAATVGRQRATRAIRRIQKRSAASAFSGWQYATTRLARLRLLGRHTVARLLHRTLARAMSGWSSHAAAMHRNRALSGRSLKWMKLRVAARAYLRWLQYVKQCRMTAHALRRLRHFGTARAMQAWVSFVHEHQRLVKQAGIVVRRIRRAMEASTMDAWCLQVQTATRQRQKAQWAVRRMQMRGVAAAFSGWLSTVEAATVGRQRATRAIRRIQKRSAASAFSGWQYATTRLARLRLLGRHTVARLLHRTLARAMSGWSSHAAAMHRNRALSGRSLKWMKLRVAARAYLRWLQYVKQCRMIAHALRRLRHFGTARAMQAWVSFVHEHQRLVKQAGIVVRRIRRAMEASTMDAWCLQVQTATRQRQKAQWAVRRMQMRGVAAAFSGWLSTVEAATVGRQRATRAIRRIQKRSAASAFSGWQYATTRLARLRLLGRHTVARLLHRTLARAMSGWSSHAAAMHRNRALSGRSLKWMKLRVAARAYLRWLQYVKQCRMIAHALRRLRHFGTARAMQAWVSFVHEHQRLVKQAGIVVRRIRRAMEASTMDAWCLQVQTATRQRQKAQWAVRRMQMRGVAAAFSGWLSTVEAATVGRQRATRAIRRIQKRSAASAFSGWQYATTRLARLRLLGRHTVARLLHRTLARAMSGWSSHAAAMHRNRVLVTSSLNRMRMYQLVSIFTGWHATMLHTQQTYILLKKAVIVLCNNKRARAWRRWRHYVTILHCSRVDMLRITKRLQHKTLWFAWSTWAHILWAKSATQSVSNGALNIWLANRCAKHYLRRMLHLWSTSCTELRISNGQQENRSLASRVDRCSHLLEVCLEKSHAYRYLYTCFRRWKCWSTNRRRIFDIFQKHSSGKLISKCSVIFDSWRARIAKEKLFVTAQIHMKGIVKLNLVSRPFMQWDSVLQRKKRQRRQLFRASNKRVQRVQLQIFTSWRTNALCLVRDHLESIVAVTNAERLSVKKLLQQRKRISVAVLRNRLLFQAGLLVRAWSEYTRRQVFLVTSQRRLLYTRTRSILLSWKQVVRVVRQDLEHLHNESLIGELETTLQQVVHQNQLDRSADQLNLQRLRMHNLYKIFHHCFDRWRSHSAEATSKAKLTLEQEAHQHARTAWADAVANCALRSKSRLLMIRIVKNWRQIASQQRLKTVVTRRASEISSRQIWSYARKLWNIWTAASRKAQRQLYFAMQEQSNVSSTHISVAVQETARLSEVLNRTVNCLYRKHTVRFALLCLRKWQHCVSVNLRNRIALGRALQSRERLRLWTAFISWELAAQQSRIDGLSGQIDHNSMELTNLGHSRNHWLCVSALGHWVRYVQHIHCPAQLANDQLLRTHQYHKNRKYIAQCMHLWHSRTTKQLWRSNTVTIALRRTGQQRVLRIFSRWQLQILKVHHQNVLQNTRAQHTTYAAARIKAAHRRTSYLRARRVLHAWSEQAERGARTWDRVTSRMRRLSIRLMFCKWKNCHRLVRHLQNLEWRVRQQREQRDKRLAWRKWSDQWLANNQETILLEAGQRYRESMTSARAQRDRLMAGILRYKQQSRVRRSLYCWHRLAQHVNQVKQMMQQKVSRQDLIRRIGQETWLRQRTLGKIFRAWCTTLAVIKSTIRSGRMANTWRRGSTLGRAFAAWRGFRFAAHEMEIERERAVFRSSLAQYERQLADMQRNQAHSAQRIAEIQTGMAQKDQQISSLETELASASEKVASATAQLEQLARAEVELEHYRTLVTEQEAELAAKEAQLDSSMGSIGEQLTKAHERGVALARTVEMRNSQLLSLEAERDTAQAERDALLLQAQPTASARLVSQQQKVSRTPSPQLQIPSARRVTVGRSSPYSPDSADFRSPTELEPVNSTRYKPPPPPGSPPRHRNESPSVRGETFTDTSRHGINVSPLLRLIPETRAQHTSPPSNRRGRR